MGRIWCISDTHIRHSELVIPDNIDIVIHSGDMGTYKDPYTNEKGVRDSLEWLNSLQIKYKVVIAGNHDTSIERKLIKPKELYPDLIYLEHDFAMVEGLCIFGSPFTPSFGQGWAYNKARHKIGELWNDIPEYTDILVTHGPPLGILDHTECGAGSEERAVISCGDLSLLKRIKKLPSLKLHVFGHIHPEERCPNSGIMQLNGFETKFVNAAVVDLDYKINNNGIIIEI